MRSSICPHITFVVQDGDWTARCTDCDTELPAEQVLVILRALAECGHITFELQTDSFFNFTILCATCQRPLDSAKVHQRLRALTGELAAVEA